MGQIEENSNAHPKAWRHFKKSYWGPCSENDLKFSVGCENFNSQPNCFEKYPFSSQSIRECAENSVPCLALFPNLGSIS